MGMQECFSIKIKKVMIFHGCKFGACSILSIKNKRKFLFSIIIIIIIIIIILQAYVKIYKRDIYIQII